MQRKVFIEKEAECPSCGQKSPLKYPNPRLYVVTDREPDQHIKAYRWAAGITTEVVPHYYFVWQCPACLFADLRSNVEDVNHRPYCRQLSQYFTQFTDDQKMALQMLRAKVGEGEFTHEAAIAIHLAAYMIITAPTEKEHLRHHDVGRLAIRIAWLYREMGDEAPAFTSREGVKQDQLADQIHKTESAMLDLDSQIKALREVALKRGEAIGLDKENEDNPYNSVTSSMTDKLEEIQNLLQMLERTGQEDEEKENVNWEMNQAANAGALDQFLSGIASFWPNVPRGEEACLNKAIEAFGYSYQNEGHFQSIERGMSVLALLVELFIRVGRPDEALEWVTRAYRTGMKGRSDLQERLRRGTQGEGQMSVHDQKMVKRKIGALNMAIQQAGEKRNRVLVLLMKKHKDTIGDVLKKNQGQPGESLIKALTENGVPEELLPILKEKGLLAQKKKSGGLFGLLKK